MADEGGGGDGGAKTAAKKSLRPEIQLYRPGMLRKGDSTKSLATDERPPRPENLSGAGGTHYVASNSSRRRSNDADSITSRNGSGSTTPDANAINEQRKYPNPRDQNRRNGESSSYNSTQSLYDSRQSGGYVRGGNSSGYQNRQNPNRRSYPSQNFERNFNRPNYHHNHQNGGSGFNDRASMRGDGAITKRNDHQGGRRRRNDSINSTQSEMPQSNNDQLHIDTSYDSVSQCGASSAFSMDSLGEAMSFEEMCASMQSFGSLDWSKEVENEFALKLEREEQEAKRLAEIQQQQQQQQVAPKILTRPNTNRTNNKSEPMKRSPRNHRRRNQRGFADESDRESSFGGSIAEEEGEDLEGGEQEELKSGERTPTSTRDNYIYQPRARNNENKRETQRQRRNNQEEKRYRGEHDDREDESTKYDAFSHMTSGRLAGRISIVKKEPVETTSSTSPINNKTNTKYR
ncbi:unnamed protein product [Caenorhabditis angaria]|uniref:Uncharacterized protein n=1 Tax=Caenorhabditis angaria TaxID=860376 RepID=A0A9P1IGB7_9PELO|nr:unnamed protein product [Caenorhabditis angaria]